MSVPVPPLAVVKKRLVVLELVAKKFVVVAEVPVAVVKVKDWRVVEPVNTLFPENPLLSARRVDDAPFEQLDPVETN